MLKSEKCRFVEENLWRYLDRELTARRVSEISLHLKSCPLCQKFYENRAREAALYRSAFLESPFGDGFAERFQKRLEQDGQRQSEKQSLLQGPSDVYTYYPNSGQHPSGKGNAAFNHGSAGRSSTGRGARRNGNGFPGPGGGSRLRHAAARIHDWLSVRMDKRRQLILTLGLSAALILVMVSLKWGNWSPGNGSSPDLVESTPDAGVGQELGHFREGQLVVHLPDGSTDQGQKILAPGQRFVRPMGDVMTWSLWDHSTLVFDRGALDFTIDKDARAGGSFSGELKKGSVTATVSPQLKSSSFKISTPNALVEVVGTRFHLQVIDAGGGRTITQLMVQEGRVRFSDSNGMLTREITPEKGMVSIPEKSSLENLPAEPFLSTRPSAAGKTSGAPAMKEPGKTAGGAGSAHSGPDARKSSANGEASNLDTPLPESSDR